MNFVVTTTNPTLFAVAPAISPGGTLTYTPAPGAVGAVQVTVTLHDDGGGADTSPAQSFIINVGSSQPWQNPLAPNDVNGDGVISPLDALVIINRIDSLGEGALGALPSPPNGPPDYLDVNGDGTVSPLDALTVINFLNAQAVAAFASPATPQAASSSRTSALELPTRLSATAVQLPGQSAPAEPSIAAENGSSSLPPAVVGPFALQPSLGPPAALAATTWSLASNPGRRPAGLAPASTQPDAVQP